MSRKRGRNRGPQTSAVAATVPVEQGIVLDTDEAKNETAKMLADREPLFTVGGVTYTIPKQVPPSWTLQAVGIATESGESDALAFAARKLLEPGAWDALMSCEVVQPSAMRTVFKALMDRIIPEGVLIPKA